MLNHNTRKKQQITKDSDEAIKANNARDNLLKPEKSPQPQVIQIKQTEVLPGQCLIEQTFDLEKDLKLLQDKYPKQYKPLLKRELISISKQENDSKNSIKIMQFKLHILYVHIL